MSIFDNIMARLGYAKASESKPPHWLGNVASAYRYTTQPDPRPVSLYTKLTWIATAVDVPAQMAASTPLEIYQSQANGEEKEITNHDFLKVWKRPNPMQSRVEFVRDALSWYKASGNLYIWLNSPNENTPPSELWILPSDKMKPVPDGKMFVKGYLLETDGGKIPLEPWEVLHVKTFNPLNPFIGLSALESLMYTANSDIAQQKWNYSLFADDNAKIPGALAYSDFIADEVWENQKAEAARQWGGTKRSGPMMLRGVGQGGVQYIQMAATQKEMEFLETRINNRDEVWQKLAPGLANVLDVNVTEANATAGKAILLEFTVYPMQVALSEKISTTILPRYGDGLTAYFEDVRETNRLIDLQEQQAYALTHTLAEIRKEYYGDEPLGDDRDSLLPAEVGKSAAPSEPQPQAPALGQPAPDGEAQVDEIQAEIKAWRNFEVKRLGKIKRREFEPRAIPLWDVTRIKAKLKAAQTLADIDAAFEQPDTLESLLAEVKAARAALESAA